MMYIFFILIWNGKECSDVRLIFYIIGIFLIKKNIVILRYFCLWDDCIVFVNIILIIFIISLCKNDDRVELGLREKYINFFCVRLLVSVSKNLFKKKILWIIVLNKY